MINNFVLIVYMVEEAIFVKSEETILLKKALAKTLYKNNIEQSKISNILAISQPMVSNYICSKQKIPNKFLNFAEKISARIIEGSKIGFYTCVSFADNTIEGNFYVANKNELISDENSKIVNNLTEAFLSLKGKNITSLIPEIKINIAMSKENPKGTEDVASFLNGLIIIDEKVAGYNGIRFGKSKHLSSLLLDLKEKIDVNAIMNIAYVKNLKNRYFKIGHLTKDYKLKDTKKQFDILLHDGDFGIEPCAYILGKDAVDVSKKVLKIVDGFKNEK